MIISCPCCKQPMNAGELPVSAILDATVWTKSQRRILTCLADAYPRPTTKAAMIDAMYWDDPDGGAETADAVFATQLCLIRKKMPVAGWHIPKQKKGHGNHGNYRLERVDG